jgi:hypothetical protein
MQLRLRRSQRTGGVLTNTVIFCLDAQAQFTADEDENIRRYKLHNQCIYNSEASLRAQERGDASHAKGTIGGNLKAIAHYAVAHLRLNITISSLARGHHIECKSLDELLGAEEAIYEACRNLRSYLDTAATFDGREVIVGFDSEEPSIIAAAAPQQTLVATPIPTAPAPAAAIAPPAAALVVDATIPDPQPAEGSATYDHPPGTTSANTPSYGQASATAFSFFSEGAQGEQERKRMIVVGAILAVILLLVWMT